MADTTRLELLCGARLVARERGRWSETRMDIAAVAHDGRIAISARLWDSSYELRGASWFLDEHAADEAAALAQVRELAERPAEAWERGRFEGREALRGDLRGRVARLALESFIDTTQGAADLARGDFGVGAGRHLAAEVARGGPLAPALLEALGHYFERAPFAPGHWAPFKRLVKLLEDQPAAREALAVALARIDGALTLTANAPAGVNLGPFLPQRLRHVARPETLAYLARRGRRWLRRLGRADPAAYVRTAAAFLAATDRQAAQTRMSSRRILSELLYGREARDDNHGRGRVSLPSPERRHAHRADRHPEAWDAHPNLVRRIWRHTQHEPAIQSWAFNVLRDGGHALPPLRGPALQLALRSPAIPVRDHACAEIAADPAPLFALDAGSLVAFLSFSTARQFAAILPALEQRAAEKTVGEAVIQVLSVHGLPALRRGAQPPGDSRTSMLVQFALRHLRPRLGAADTYLLAQHVGRSTGFRPLRAWRQVLGQLPLRTLVELRLRLPALAPSVRRAIDAACVDAADGAGTDPHAAPALVASGTPTLRRLGWSMLANAGDAAIARAWATLLEAADTPAGLAGLREALTGPDAAIRLARLEQLDDAAALLADLALAVGAEAPRQRTALLLRLAARGDARLAVDTLARLAADATPSARPAWARLLRRFARIDAGVPAALRAALDAETSPALEALCLEARPLAALLVEASDPGEIAAAGDASAARLAGALRLAPTRLYRDTGFALACCLCPQPVLQQFALARLSARKRIAPLALALAESGMPAALAAAERYVGALRDTPTITAAVIALCDSGARAARGLGLALVERCAARLDWPRLLNALAEHPAPEIAALVAARAGNGDALRRETRRRFEQRVLATRRVGRRAKELVKRRLDAESAPPPGVTPLEAAPLDALLALARGSTLCDRDWALRRLAQLALDGHRIPELTVSHTT